jgi:hypothetical protein
MKIFFLFLGLGLIGLWVAGMVVANFTDIDPDKVCAPFFSGLGTALSGLKMDRLTLFGLFAVSAMLFCYAFEVRSRWFVLGFALACVMGSAYGFLQGAWPFGLVEGIWSLVAFRRWAAADTKPLH